MSPELKRTSALMASLIGYTGFVVGIWATPWSLSTRIVLLVVVILIGVAAWAYFRGEQARRELRARAADLEGGMVALAFMRGEEPIADLQNHYSEVVESYRIDGDDATYKYTLRGQRVAEETGEFLVFKVSGDSAVDASNMLAEAVDLTTNTPLSVNFIRDESYFKVIQIIFKSPIAQGETFDIEVTLRWAGTFPRARRHDYFFSSWGLYARCGIDRLVCKLSSDLEFRNVILEESRGGGHPVRSPFQPKIDSVNKRCEVTWSSTNPGVLYILHFEKVSHSE